MGDIAASGGYYLAAACDRIVSNPGSLVGSIGVIVNTFNFSSIMQKYGIKRVVIKAGKFKDLLNSARPINPEEIRLIQTLVDDTFQQFFNAVKKSRKKVPLAKLKMLCDGRIFSGNIAYKLKMVDKLGGYFTALELVKKLARLPHAPRVHIDKAPSFFNLLKLLRTRNSSANALMKLRNLMAGGEYSSPLLYLYTGF